MRARRTPAGRSPCRSWSAAARLRGA
jgi:hypothetical protein